MSAKTAPKGRMVPTGRFPMDSADIVAECGRLKTQVEKLEKALRLYRESHNFCIEGEPQGLCNKCRLAEFALATGQGAKPTEREKP